MKQFLIVFSCVLLLLVGCKKDKTQMFSADTIINDAIEIAGGKRFENAMITFNFRDKFYKATRNHGQFQLEREFSDSINKIRDVLSNSGFSRYINGELITIQDSMAIKYTSSVNSVHYFSVLPYGLNAAAVNKTYLDMASIKGQDYHKIKVTFSQDGGGEDFEDVFVYWVHTETSKVDYLAYSYAEADGVGFRFREAYNERIINGLRFVDYNNYTPKSNNVSLLELDDLFVVDDLKLLSKIELKNVRVNWLVDSK